MSRMAATESLQQRLAEVFKDVQPTQSTLLDVAAAITDAIVKVLSEACRNILAVDWSSQRNTIQRQISDVLEQGRLPQFIKIRLPDAVMDALAEAQRRVLAVDWSKLLETAMQWPKDHPYKTIFVLFCAVSYKYPGLLFKPALKVLGYSLRGPRAGSLASGAQAMIGNVPARGVFATLQSAAMGGYGGAAVSIAIMVLAASAAVVTCAGPAIEPIRSKL